MSDTEQAGDAGAVGHVVELPAEIVMENAEDLRDRLLAVVDESDVTLDASAVARVHGVALQLLCGFFLERERAGLATAWRGAGEPLRTAAEMLGLAETIQLLQEQA